MPRRPKPAVATPDLRLELAPRLGGREALGRQDTLLVGQVIAAAPVAAVAVTSEGQLLARIDYGAAAARDAPGPRGFQLVLARRLTEAAPFWRFTVHVTTTDGGALDVPCAARREPGGDGGVIEEGPLWTLAPDTAPLPPLIAYIERAALDPAGTLAVTGWSLAVADLVAVQAFMDLDRVGAARLRGPRDDLAAHYAAYPATDRAGFTLTTRIAPEYRGATALTVTAIAADGTTLAQYVPLERAARLDPPPDAVGPADPAARAAERRRIHHHCDTVRAEAGELRLGGWAISALGIDAILVRRGGVTLGEAILALPRPDVAAAYPTIPMARQAGFAFAMPLDPPPAPDETIEVTIRNLLGDTETLELPIAVATPAAPRPAAEAAFRLEIDRPALAEGAMVEPVTTRLTIEGWVLARHAPIEGVTVYLDGQRLGEAHGGLARQDVERAFPDWPGALRCGFAFHVPPRLLRPGAHRLRLAARAADGSGTERAFAITVQPPEGAEDGPGVRARIGPAEAGAQTRYLAALGAAPAFRLLILDPSDPGLAATLASLNAQSLGTWHADLAAADAAEAAALRARFGGAARLDAVRVGTWPPASVPAATLCAVLHAGDMLDAGALAEIALAQAVTPDADFLYADEARTDPVSLKREAFFKPDFSPDLLLAWNYIGRPWFASAALLRRAGGLGVSADDLMLRLTEQARAVHHVPLLLARSTDVAADPAATLAAREAALARRGIGGTIAPGLLPGRFRQRHAASAGRVSILIPTNGADGHIETCIASLRARTRYRDFEIICVENIPPARAPLRERLRDLADQVIAAPAAFNWSHFNNLATAAARGTFLLFLNDDIEVIEEDWLDALLDAAQDPDVGVVGARLLYPDRTVQHAGMFLSGTATGRHAFRFAAETDPGYFGLALTQRNVSAVTGACMMMRRAHFDVLGGFDAAHEVINNDLDFCLRTLEAGRRVVYTPHASLIHHELASRGGLNETYDLARFERRWRTRFALGDSFHNPNLATDHDDGRPIEERLRVVHGGGPRIAREQVRRILAVKLDHIGDFVTALPAIRRLGEVFPEASIHVLASPAAVSLAALEPTIAEIIPFAFFHARSALGQAEPDAGDLAALDARLAALRPDLAIDLRKHLDTREILRRAHARWTAGYDHMGQFPWLDIALEWEGDRALHPKRQHITEDLLRLVAAVELAATARPGAVVVPSVISPGIPPVIPPVIPLGGPLGGPLPTPLGALFDRPVVVVHPGAGNAMKQWPASHFIALLGLILARHPVRILLIGGAEEAAVAAAVAAGLGDPDRVGSAVGQLGLGALPGVLARCALFIGNDSGPKHIAAALGVPTLGIHSGTVDPAEWGPLGDTAMAVARAMSCAPCYLNRPEDCPRDLVCIRGIAPGAVYRLVRPILAALAPPAAPLAAPRRRRHAPAR